MYRQTITYYLADGTRKRKDIRAKTKKDLINKITQFNLDLEKGEVFSNPQTLIKIYALKWLDLKKPSIGYRQFVNYKGYIKNHIIPYIGGLRLIEVKRSHIQAVINKQHKSKALAEAVKMTMYQIFESAVDEELIKSNPVRNIEIPLECTNGTHRAITKVERQAIYEVAENNRAGLWALTMLLCGLRPSETKRLTWNDIDLKKELITVRKSKTKAGTRKIPMPSYLVDKFSLEQKNGVFVFTKSNGKPLDDSALSDMWKSLKRDLDISLGAKVYRNKIVISVVAKDLTAYCLRHTYATDLQNAGVPINVAKVLLGHSDISTTANIYTHYNKEAQEDARTKINSYTSVANEWQTKSKQVEKL